MKLTVIGATGGIGHAVVAQALEAGHHVTAVLRDPAKLDADVPAAVVDLAAPDPDALRDAIDGADAVLSGLGPRGRGEVGIVTPGTEAILEAMRDTGTRRILAVTGVGLSLVRTLDRPGPPRREPGAGLIMHAFTLPVSRLILRDHVRDVATAEGRLVSSGLDWTSVRVPYLLDRPPTGVYKVAYGRSLPRAFRLGRADAAHFMLGAVDDERAIARHVTVAY